MLVAVYDIKNCGPRHRFVANGKLVHNSGGVNLCNLPRVSGKPSDALRNSLVAPPGHKVIVADLSGIELRVNMTLWKVPYAMEAFKADRANADLYKSLASEVLCVPIENMPKMVRQAGKAMHLGCGYGLKNRKKYIAVAKSMAQITVTEEEAELHIDGYSRKHPELSGKTNGGWARCGYGLQAILKGTEYIVDPWGLVRTDGEGFVLPSGRKIRYPGLRLEHDEERGRPSLVYGEGRNRARIYGAKADENIVQALARDVFKDNLLEIKRRTGEYPAHEVYDELVYVVPEESADNMLATVLEVMRTPPAWWPELLVWAEGDIAESYGSAKG